MNVSDNRYLVTVRFDKEKKRFPVFNFVEKSCEGPSMNFTAVKKYRITNSIPRWDPFIKYFKLFKHKGKYEQKVQRKQNDSIDQY
jgi:hypothetical protein